MFLGALPCDCKPEKLLRFEKTLFIYRQSIYTMTHILRTASFEKFIPERKFFIGKKSKEFLMRFDNFCKVSKKFCRLEQIHEGVHIFQSAILCPKMDFYFGHPNTIGLDYLSKFFQKVVK